MLNNALEGVILFADRGDELMAEAADGKSRASEDSALGRVLAVIVAVEAFEEKLEALGKSSVPLQSSRCLMKMLMLLCCNDG
jgi:hypothetical protein